MKLGYFLISDLFHGCFALRAKVNLEDVYHPLLALFDLAVLACYNHLIFGELSQSLIEIAAHAAVLKLLLFKFKGNDKALQSLRV